MAWSFSKIKDYSCPLRYKRKWIEGHAEPSTVVAIKGQICADLMAEIRTHWIEHEEILDGESLLGIAHASAAGHGGDETLGEEALEIVKGALKRMDGLLPPKAEIKGFNIETGLAFDAKWNRLDLDQSVYYGQGWDMAFWKCKPDFTWMNHEGRLTIEDDKSGWNEADPAQLLAYAWCVKQTLAYKGVEVAEIELRFNYLAKYTSVSVSPLQVDAFPTWLDEQTAIIEADTTFQPVMGKHCDWCGFVDECPKHATIKGQLETIDPETLGQITTPEQAIKGGLWLMAAERCVTVAKERLKAYVKENGPVVLADTGKVLECRAASSVLEASVADVYEVMIEEGQTSAAILNGLRVSGGKVEDYVNKLYPTGGAGVTKAVRAERYDQRRALMERIEAVSTKTGRAGSFGIFNQ